MAIAKMQRIKLIGLKSEQKKVMNILARSGAFEAAPTSDLQHGSRGGNQTHLNRVVAKQAKVSFAINFLNTISLEMVSALEQNQKDIKRNLQTVPIEYDYSPPKAPVGRQIIGYDDFYDIAAKEYELLDVADQLEQLSFNRLEIKSKLNKLNSVNKNLEPYKNCPIKFSMIKDLRHAFVMLAAGKINVATEALKKFDCHLEHYESSVGVLIAIVGKIADKEKISQILTDSGFAMCPYNYDKTAQQLIDENLAEQAQLLEKSFNFVKEGVSYCKYLTELKVLYDVLGQEIETSTVELNFVKTRDTFVLEGWVPEQASSWLIERVKLKTEKIITELSAPAEGEMPPTLIKSKKVFKAYEDITNMYSVPSYHENDPNPFMAVFFFVFFGIMIGDAGYGLILSLVCFIGLKVLKLEKGMSKMLALVGMGGISAIVWGLVFGGIFSIEGVPPLWFNPMQDPIKMLILSLCLGAVQLLVGYALNAAKLFKRGKALDAILDTVFIYILFGGIACIAMSLVIKPSNGTLSLVGIGMMCLSLAGILLTAGRHNKGIAGKILGGLSGLYGLVNILSDVLSYARLFGLALASGAIGYAFNILGGMFFDMPIPVLGEIIGFIVLIPLHAFNLGIGVLGAYVHNARLQFLEFYGKFYEGGGSLFTPMGEKTKYVRFA